MTNGTPIHLAPPNSPPYPDHYVVYVTQQHCVCCNKFTFKQDLYAITFLKSTLGLGQRVKNARPVKWPSSASDALFNLPIRVEHRPGEQIPFCFQCNEPSLSAWPNVPQELTETNLTTGEQPSDTKAPAAGHVARATPESRTSTKEPKSSGSKVKTLDDVLKLF